LGKGATAAGGEARERFRGKRTRALPADELFSCHAINGTTADTRVGPDLTHLASRRQLGAGIADNMPENLRRWLADPQRVKPGAKMPDFKFSDEQLTQLVDYFQTLK
jgi:cytochrome c oxidase subunit 2